MQDTMNLFDCAAWVSERFHIVIIASVRKSTLLRLHSRPAKTRMTDLETAEHGGIGYWGYDISNTYRNRKNFHQKDV